MKEKRRYEFRGEMLTVGEIAKRTGISKATISCRLHAGRRGESLAEPLVDRSEAGRRAMEARRKRQQERGYEAEMPIEEIAKELGVSRTYINNIENDALEKARKRLERMGITKDDLP